LKGRLELGDQVVLLRSRQGTEVLPQLLARWGYEVRELSLYSLRGERTWDEKRPLDYLLFASAGGVEAFFAGGDVAEGAVCVCIGPVTARALAGHGYRTFLTAAEISAEGLVQAILRHHAGGEQAEGEPIREPELKDFRTGTRENKKGEST
uniref:uroporphyrinogen-III synthase n=1 Tax=Dysosmobacter welbionis TaxID=2093857 RepID=UPI003FEFDAFD